MAGARWLLAIALSGCGSFADPEATRRDSGLADPIVEPGSAKRPRDGFTVRVLDDAPVIGARVAHDFGDGTEPTVVVTDGEGRATFRGIAPHHASFTAWAEGHTMTSLVDVSGSTNDETMIVLGKRPSSDGFVTISGALRGKNAAANFVTITSPQGGNVFQDVTPTYSVRVRAGQPIALVVLEWTKGSSSVTSWDETKVRWLRLEHSAVASDVTFDLDLRTALPLASKKVNVSMSVPPGNTLSAPPFWQVQPLSRRTPSPLLGSRSHVMRISSNEFTAPGELAEGLTDFAPYTWAVAPGLEGESAESNLAGAPVEGTTIDFLAYPSIPTSASLGGSIMLPPLDESIDGVTVSIVDDVSVVWSIVAAGRPRSITMPELPSDARALLPSKLYARLMVKSGAISPDHPEIPARAAWSAVFAVGP